MWPPRRHLAGSFDPRPTVFSVAFNECYKIHYSQLRPSLRQNMPSIPFISILFLLAFFSRGAAAYFPQGYITQPVNGTRVAPGASFAFKYNIRQDYCLSSLGYSVWLLTSEPNLTTGIGPESEFGTGHFFGRWQDANLAGVCDFLFI
jgi:hypothetical protein